MTQRDLIKDQIEQLGRVLGKMLDTLLALESGGKVAQDIQLSKKQLNDELDIDLDHLLLLDKNDTPDYLDNKLLAPSHFEQLADCLIEMAKLLPPEQKEEQIRLLEKSVTLLELADKKTSTFSFDRFQKKVDLLSFLLEVKSD